jgi:hypothetical protein
MAIKVEVLCCPDCGSTGLAIADPWLLTAFCDDCDKYIVPTPAPPRPPPRLRRD